MLIKYLMTFRENFKIPVHVDEPNSLSKYFKSKYRICSRKFIHVFQTEPKVRQ